MGYGIKNALTPCFLAKSTILDGTGENMIVNSTSLYIPFAEKSFHTIVTSPPYFGLRAYSGKQEHDWPGGTYSPMTGVPACVDVSAWLGGYGAEPTVEMYVWHTLLVMRECWRVLRDDGVMWWDVGDSYSGSWGNYGGKNRGNGHQREIKSGSSIKNHGYDNRENERPSTSMISLVPGNLIGIPHRVMLAAQADGWVVRNDCVWAKKSAMPESVNGWRFQPKRCACVQDQRGSEAYRKEAYGDHPQTDHDPDGSFAEPQADPNCEICNGTGEVGAPVMRKGSWRHTRSHEYVFMLTKCMGYYSNAEDAKEGAKEVTGGGFSNSVHENRLKAWGTPSDVAGQSWSMRNPRTVMSPSPAPWKGAHYAVFPPDLISPLIRATTPSRCCPHCGQAWAPVVVKKSIDRKDTYDGKHKDQDPQSSHKRLQMGVKAGREAGLDHDNTTFPSKVIGYRQTCKCPEHEPIPGIVYDPFFGSGTTGQVARELGLRYAGTDISFEYITEQAILRAQKKTPKNALKSLPMFADLVET